MQDKALLRAFAEFHCVFDMQPAFGGAHRVNNGNTDRLELRIFKMSCQYLLSGRIGGGSAR
jgi:hypothetical protein